MKSCQYGDGSVQYRMVITFFYLSNTAGGDERFIGFINFKPKDHIVYHMNMHKFMLFFVSKVLLSLSTHYTYL